MSGVVQGVGAQRCIRQSTRPLSWEGAYKWIVMIWLDKWLNSGRLWGKTPSSLVFSEAFTGNNCWAKSGKMSKLRTCIWEPSVDRSLWRSWVDVEAQGGDVDREVEQLRKELWEEQEIGGGQKNRNYEGGQWGRVREEEGELARGFPPEPTRVENSREEGMTYSVRCRREV